MMYYNLILSIVLFFLLFLLLEGHSWLKNSLGTEYCWAVLLFLLALIYTIDLVQGWHLMPNPAAIFAKLKPLSDLLETI
ncbi:MAG: hypothetical protein PHG94_09710 [Syntrophomonas sp.]|uniref:hypothetical protein n=1 Tax=Syntrophomonas sp. TaxID=2053627 RepID=UPI0026176464|nr:hypothetical protein [Syntrophomonas sp.]MDD2511384.1 hypothetical protein [Syntrophomonas sp.]MDD4627365.1 hypothetical protein [Syntrophomonas sp.]